MNAARSGHGSVVFVAGEAGVGRTSLVRAFAERVRDGARVLMAACDDLTVPRPAGPLRDTVRQTSGPLAAALADGIHPAAAFPALLDELALHPPTVLVVEDVQWADDVTFDLLRYAACRLERVGAVLVLTGCDDGVRATGRLRAALASCPVHHLRIGPLSRAAVTFLAHEAGRDIARLYELTGGNPFLVTALLEAESGALPGRVTDAVLARFHRLGGACRDALAQLCVLPRLVPFDLAEALLGGQGIDALAEAEVAGMVEVARDGLAVRPELARRVIERSLPRLHRRRLHQAVVEALCGQPHPRPDRILRHAVLAGDARTLAAAAPAAAREAAARGDHQRALALIESVLPHLDRLSSAEQAAVLDSYAQRLHGAQRFREAVRAWRDAAARYGRLGDGAASGLCLTRLAGELLITGAADKSLLAATQAIELLDTPGLEAELGQAYLVRGMVLVRIGEPEHGAALLERAERLAAEADEALCRAYLGVARAELGDPAGAAQLRAAVTAAISAGQHETAATGYTLLAEVLYREGRLGELEACVGEGSSFTRDHDLRVQRQHLEAHRCVLLLRRGAFGEAAEGLRALSSEAGELGYAQPWLALLAVRRGDRAASAALAETWQRARRHRLLTPLAYAGIAYLEWAWLTGDQQAAGEVAGVLLPLLSRPGLAPLRAEALCHLARAGIPVEPFPGCPQPYAASLRGDRYAAAQEWQALGDPYQAALELGFSGEASAMQQAVRALDGLGATAAARLVRERLRATGGRTPRGPRRRSRSNPAGLTDQQLTVLRLLGSGLTNAQIAARLVLSVRTVDHHVAAILRKLDVPSRRDAAAAAVALGI